MEDVIGGEFLIDPQKYRLLEEYPKTLNLFSCGRAALYAILQAVSVHERHNTVLVPDYLCSSVTRTIEDVGMKYKFYHIGGDLLPEWETLEPYLTGADAILLIGYFGLVDLQPVINRLRGYSKDDIHPVILLDCVQDYYGMDKIKGYDFAFSSLRKWFPVPDGAEIRNTTKKCIGYFNGHNKFAQYKFAGNILKYFSTEVEPRIYLELLEQGEQILDLDYRCECSDISRKIIPTLEIEAVAEIRKRNARILHEGLSENGIRHLFQEDSVPMAIPIFLPMEQRDKVRRWLFNENIFAPVHWSWENRNISGENTLYDTELSLICDQRYGSDDMHRELVALKSAIGSSGK